VELDTYAWQTPTTADTTTDNETTNAGRESATNMQRRSNGSRSFAALHPAHNNISRESHQHQHPVNSVKDLPALTLPRKRHLPAQCTPLAQQTNSATATSIH